MVVSRPYFWCWIIIKSQWGCIASPSRSEIQLQLIPSSQRSNRLVVSDQADTEPGAQSSSNARLDALFEFTRLFLANATTTTSIRTQNRMQYNATTPTQPHLINHLQYQPLHWGSIMQSNKERNPVRIVVWALIHGQGAATTLQNKTISRLNLRYLSQALIKTKATELQSWSSRRSCQQESTWTCTVATNSQFQECSD